MLELKTALGIAERYLGRDYPYNCVRLGDGRVRAMTPIHGCDLVCADATVDATLDGARLSKIVSAIKGTDQVKLSIAKGDKLQVEAEGSRWRVQTIPSDHPYPDPPKKKWQRVESVTVEALTTIDRLAPDEGVLAGIHLTHRCAIVATQMYIAIVWSPILPTPCTIPGGFLRGLEGHCDMRLHDHTLWVRDADGSHRWTQTFGSEYPSDSVMQQVMATRNARQRLEIELTLSALGSLASRAATITDDKVTGFRLSVDDRLLTMSGIDQSGKRGAAEFSGSIEIDPMGTTRETRVVAPNVQRVAGLLGGLPGPQKIAVAGPTDALSLWVGQDVVVEALLQPIG